MKAPKIIYLQIGEDCDVPDFSEATWCVDKQFSNDVEYRRPDLIFQELRDAKATIDAQAKEIERLEYSITSALVWLTEGADNCPSARFVLEKAITEATKRC